MPAKVVRLDVERERRRVLAAMPGTPESVPVLPYKIASHPDAVEFVIGEGEDRIELWLTPGQACGLGEQLSASGIEAGRDRR